MNRTRLLCAFALLAALTLAGCGAVSSEEHTDKKEHYYEILQGEETVLYTVTDPDAVARIDALVDNVGIEEGWPGDEGGEPLYTYVSYQEKTPHAGKDPEAEREYLEVLRLAVRADSDTVTAYILSGQMTGLTDVLPQVDFQGLMTFSAAAGAETASALRDPAALVEDGALAETMNKSYYAGQEDRACRMLQKSIFRSLLDQWTPADVKNPVWNYETFTRYAVLDEKLEPLGEDALYCCTFSGDDGKAGYMVVSYEGEGLSCVRMEETPYLYDLTEKFAAITEALRKTELDLATAEAARVQIPGAAGGAPMEGICITDGAGRRALCRFEENGVTVTAV